MVINNTNNTRVGGINQKINKKTLFLLCCLINIQIARKPISFQQFKLKCKNIIKGIIFTKKINVFEN